jgi:SAM-dependent methyltransferase
MARRSQQAPKIVNQASWAKFRTLAKEMGRDPDDPWVGGYVAYEWTHSRHFFESYTPQLDGKRVLEFGCNVGASGIVLASLGADVVGVEVDREFAALAEAQASAYGLEARVSILHLRDTTRMPFPEFHFNLIICNSVLEYVDPAYLAAVQKELLRVLVPGGLILILGTSNSLWPREVHSRGWLSNYVPRGVDRFLGRQPLQRGISPFKVRSGFPGCVLVDKEDKSATYLAARKRMGTHPRVLTAMRIAAVVLNPFELTVGMLMPSFAMALRRKLA